MGHVAPWLQKLIKSLIEFLEELTISSVGASTIVFLKYSTPLKTYLLINIIHSWSLQFPALAFPEPTFPFRAPLRKLDEISSAIYYFQPGRLQDHNISQIHHHSRNLSVSF